MIPSIRARWILLSILGWTALLGCRKQPDSAKSPAATASEDSEIVVRYPEVEQILQRRQVKVLHRSWTAVGPDYNLERAPEYSVDLATSPGLSTYRGLDSLGEELAAIRKDPALRMALSDPTRKVRVAIRSLIDEPAEIIYTDSSGYLPIPAPIEFAKGGDRVVKPVGDFAKTRKKNGETITTYCASMADANGALYYVVGGSIDFGAMAGPHPLKESWMDARTGKEYIPLDSRTLFESKTRKRIHLGPDSSSKAWRTVGYSCNLEDEPAYVWQVRTRDHRIQRLELDGPSLALDLGLDSSGLAGPLESLVELSLPDSGHAHLAALATDSTGTRWLYRSTPDRLFGERAPLPESFRRKPGPLRPWLDDSRHSSSDTVLVGYSPLGLEGLEWNPSPGARLAPATPDTSSNPPAASTPEDSTTQPGSP